MNQPPHKPEILAPAGGLPQLQAAVHAGADAVYFGLSQGLNARVRSAGIAPDELEQTMQFLHAHGCKGYLAINVLVFDEELADAEQQIRHAARCGVDALIVQDIGLIRLARATAPHLPIHGSTQMSITDAEGIRFAQSLGIERVVVGRELSIDEISGIQAETTVEIEAFVHGALCVSYSGQCFSSEAWGGRSANRGQCAQACRLPYGLLVDGQLREQGEFNYLLSPQDLMALPLLPKLIEAGVSCFKIEGRLKGPEYVLSTVSAYREALDKSWQAHQQGKPKDHWDLDRNTRRRLAQVFSRGQDANADGLTPGFLEGPRHQELVIGRSPRHRGLYLGKVDEITDQGVRLQLHGPVKAGDGVVFDNGQPQHKEAGGNVFHLLRNGKRVNGEIDSGEVELQFGRNFRAERIGLGDYVWRTKDTRMDSGPRLHRENAAEGLPVQVQFSLAEGQPLRLTLQDRHGHRVEVQGEQPAQPARGKPVDEAAVLKAIGKLGDTPFALVGHEIQIDGELFLPLAEIKQARREATEQLQQQLLQHDRDREMPSEPVLNTLLPSAEPVLDTRPRLSLLCRSAEQVQAALQIDGLDEIIVDFLEVHGLKPACESVKAAGKRLVVAAPRIFKPGEQRLVRYFLSLSPDALLVRSPGLLWQLHQAGGTGGRYLDEFEIPELHGDFSLNAANWLSADGLLQLGLTRLALTHDVNAAQIEALSRGLPQQQRERIELIAHHHLPIFHTEHCVFARFMSSGNSYRDCGRPCEHHAVHVRDPGGADHLVLADIGCRNTVFNAQAQSAAPFSRCLIDSGIGHWRIELVDEPAEEVAGIVNGYRELLAGRIDHQQLWKQLRRVPDANHHAQGVGSGSLEVRVEQLKSSMKKPTAR